MFVCLHICFFASCPLCLVVVFVCLLVGWLVVLFVCLFVLFDVTRCFRRIRLRPNIDTGICHPLHGPASTAVVNNLADALAWLGYQINCLGGEPLLEALAAKRYGGFTMSTAFSGIGAPKHLMEAIRAVLHQWQLSRGEDCGVWAVKNLATVDYNQHSRHELMCPP